MGFNFLAVVRYKLDGSLDTTFGIGVIIVTTISGRGNAVAIQKDGKIVVVGDLGFNFVVVRFNTDGSFDVNFGTGGIEITDFGGSDSGNAVALQKDGKIVVAGTAVIGDEDFAVARYNTDGKLDPTFNPTGGLPGTVTTNFGGIISTDDEGNAVIIQKDGKIIVAGTSDAEGTDDFAIARYNTDGGLDVTFNPTGSLPGTVTTDFGISTDRGKAVALQKDGKIVVAGDSNNDFAVARYVVFKRGVVVRNCIAEENGEDGFNIAGSAYDLRDSAAIHNVADGFLLKSLTDFCQLLSNEALQNSNIGIENLGTDNQIFNNRAHGNAGGNYTGVPLVTTATLTTSFWANVEA